MTPTAAHEEQLAAATLSILVLLRTNRCTMAEAARMLVSEETAVGCVPMVPRGSRNTEENDVIQGQISRGEISPMRPRFTFAEACEDAALRLRRALDGDNISVEDASAVQAVALDYQLTGGQEREDARIRRLERAEAAIREARDQSAYERGASFR